MFKKLWKKIKKSLGNQPTARTVEARRSVTGQPGVPDTSKPTKTQVPAPTTRGAMQPPPEPPRPTRSAGACPSYAAKSVVGQRMTMEDSWQAVPDLLLVPKWWTCNARDHLPPVVAPSAPAEGAGDPQPAQQQGQEAASSIAAGIASTPSGGPEAASSSGRAPMRTGSRSAMDPKLQAEKHGTEPVTVHFFAVYDGHGGPDVAKHCAKSLHEHLRTVVAASVKPDGTATSGPLAAPAGPAEPAAAAVADSAKEGGAAAAAPPDPPPAEEWPARVDGIEAALKAAFLHTDAQLAQNRSAHEVGTTAVVSLVTARTLWIGNCGDSRALLCREHEAVALSLDHKATRVDEVSRVEQAGGYVWWDRVMGELAVSRAIGDHCLRPFVIAEPEITSVVRRTEDQLLIMASDGLWDVFTNEEARTLALDKFNGELQRTLSSKLAVKKAASSLAKAALAKGSRDNVTVVVVDVRVSGRGHNGASRSAGTPRTAPSQPVSGLLPAASQAEQQHQQAQQQQPQSEPQQQQQVAASPATPGGSDTEK
ncbi:hypothetical protein PLESTB_001534000 [Pleodorina starrii]|uniref:protein-serine/threonine phosphatase n=1 Tax=Pleodorina starrii TaxID=330485 RepID=A0A9W6F7X3_9CHLO|nr:hypothetical protein PLESTM_001839400 [Pleodorina starrii]GLC59772.1 hypothetical protein PLESTB_001534000 [Pleodorina starrii]GLC67346.1 hypothetical protein PLESTF_000544900 [Pleodorina starrii]